MKRTFFFLLLLGKLYADSLTDPLPEIWRTSCNCPRELRCIEECVSVDLINPIYEGGVLTTEEGGVLVAPDLRVQSRHIVYTKKLDANPPVFTVECEGDLLIDYQGRAIVGQRLYYDFLTHTGVICEGKTADPPWYVGGKEFRLEANGDLVVLGGYITTSEGGEEALSVQTPRITLRKNRVMTAKHINFRVKKVPLFWFPFAKFDLKNFGKSPFKVKFGWGGFLGSNLGIRYQLIDIGAFKGFARVDWFVNKGMGGGIETSYDPKDNPREFYTRNYYAADIPIDSPERRNRWRFQGVYEDCIWHRSTTMKMKWDVVSDAKMAYEYTTNDFDLKTAKRTQLQLRRQDELWITNLFARAKVNEFQSIKQELPTIDFDIHPLPLWNTGIIFDNRFSAAYVDYSFSNDVQARIGNFHSSRVAAHPRLYRPFYLGPVTVTPEAAFIGIAYNDSPGGRSAGQAVGDFGCRVEAALSRHYGPINHVLEPYIDYHFWTNPAVSLERHFLFDINDAYDRYNLMRFGVRNLFFPGFSLDLWGNAFFDTETIPKTIPKGYANLEWNPSPYMFIGGFGGWNFEEGLLDFINGRADWTWNENFAFGVEYRHRSRYDWRKADFYNFLLESVQPEEFLVNSILSDKRDTFLFRTFLRITPDLWSKFSLRHGWNRPGQKNYTEYDLQLGTVLMQHWRLSFIYERREADDRYSFNLKLDPPRPRR